MLRAAATSVFGGSPVYMVAFLHVFRFLILCKPSLSIPCKTISIIEPIVFIPMFNLPSFCGLGIL